jgi:hypothetical protein
LIGCFDHFSLLTIKKGNWNFSSSPLFSSITFI